MSDDCIDPPPGQLPEEQRARVAYPDELNGHEESGFPIRKALHLGRAGAARAS